MQEIWKDIPGFKFKYQVSNASKVRILDRPTSERSQQRKDRKKLIPGYELKQRLRAGYYSVHLRGERKGFDCVVHRLMAIAFIPNPENLPQVNHKNGIKNDNSIENLEWCSVSANTFHAYDMGLAKSGESAPKSKLTEQQIKEIFLLKYQGISGNKIAKKFGVYKNTIYHILNGRNWRRVTNQINANQWQKV